MKNKELTAKIIQCITESLMVEDIEIGPDTRLINDLGADSLDFIDIMFQFETQFGVKLQKEDFNLLSRVDLPVEEAVEGEFITAEAKRRLLPLLPGLPSNENIRVSDLGGYITVMTLQHIIENHKKSDT